jgi:uncharacterized hydrophobic protein (TIGR00271 family)
MVHLRIVVPPDRTEAALERLEATDSVTSVIVLPAAARRPDGDVVLADVAREDASVILARLRELGIHEDGSISAQDVDTQLSAAADAAERHAPGSAADAVIWEEVEQRTSENVELSGVFVLFMLLASVIAAVGIVLDSPVLIVGAMVVGPEFGPIAGLCVALVQRQPRLAARSALALAVALPLAMVAGLLSALAFKATGLTPEHLDIETQTLARTIARPDAFAVIVALCAGAAGVLSLSTAKSGALIGVLISVTTIPAAVNVGVSAAYQDWEPTRGSLGQLGLNLASIFVAGTVVLGVQRALYARRLSARRATPTRPPSSAPSRSPRR